LLPSTCPTLTVIRGLDPRIVTRGNPTPISRARDVRRPLCDGRRLHDLRSYLFTVATWWEGDSVDPTRLPKLADHRKRVAERPAVKRALAAEAKK